jgi:hypothetical protein
MRKFYLFLSTLLLLSFINLNAQDTFTRTGEISVGREPNGFGNLIAGVDFDGDGWPEIYAVNNNTVDADDALIPRIYKFEWNGTSWDSVWGAELSEIPLQNTWPALAYGDVDGDGKMEIWWAPINWTDAATNPNPSRIVVFEYPGDDSDNMGVDLLGTFVPNAQWSIVDQDGFNLRPHKFLIQDFDNDGNDELIFSDRAGTYHFGVVSVSDIPDDASGNEVWSLKAHGFEDPILAGTGAKWDFALLENRIVVIAQNGRVFSITYDDGTYTVQPSQDNLMGGSLGSSFKSAVTVDIDGDGTEEILVASWFAPKVWLLQEDGDTLVSTEIADLADLGALRLNGGAAGDVNGDGNLDYIFGSRYVAGTTPNNAIYRLAYLGGDITSPDSYEASIVDSLQSEVGDDMDIIYVGNVDGDDADEIFYSSGYPRGDTEDIPSNIIILDLEYTPVSVKNESPLAPEAFFMEQNYPNPFNPSTSIRIGLTTQAVVDLKVYDILGKVVMNVIAGETMSAGTYNVTIDARHLASGTYVYTLSAGGHQVSKKMILLK